MKHVVETRDYQTRAIAKFMKAIDDGHRDILIEAPTGSGKTCCAHIIAKQLYEQRGWRTGWTAMRKHLLIQAADENDNKFKLQHIKYFSMFNDNPPTDIDMLVIDECQHSCCDSAITILNKIKPKVHCGLSASPYRVDRLKLAYSMVIKDAGLRALIDQGWLAPYHHYIYSGEWTPDNVARLYLKYYELWGKSIGFFLTEVECQACAAIIRAGGRQCEIVTGHSDQERQIEEFNNNQDLNILLNMVVLTEGFDCPRLKTAFIRPGSKGPTQQMGGRVFRKHLDKSNAIIVQNSYTKWPFTKLASAEQRFVYNNDNWCSLTRNERAESACIRAIEAIARIDVQLPPFCSKVKAARSRFRANDGPITDLVDV